MAFIADGLSSICQFCPVPASLQSCLREWTHQEKEKNQNTTELLDSWAFPMGQHQNLHHRSQRGSTTQLVLTAAVLAWLWFHQSCARGSSVLWSESRKLPSHSGFPAVWDMSTSIETNESSPPRSRVCWFLSCLCLINVWRSWLGHSSHVLSCLSGWLCTTLCCYFTLQYLKKLLGSSWRSALQDVPIGQAARFVLSWTPGSSGSHQHCSASPAEMSPCFTIMQYNLQAM